MTLRATSTKKKKHSLSVRLRDADIAIIDRAATLCSRSRADFVRDAAVRAAQEVLMEHTFVRMGPSGFNAFMRALSKPTAPVPEMVELLKRSTPWGARRSRK